MTDINWKEVVDPPNHWSDYQRFGIEDSESMEIEKEKFKALFEYQKTQFENEKTRYSKLEDKSAKYLTALTIIISAFTLAVAKFLDVLSSDTNCLLNALFIFLITLTFICFCSAWSLIFKSLKLNEVPKLAASLEMIDFFLDNSLETVYWDISEKYASAIKAYEKINSGKSILMANAHKEITFASWPFMLSIILMFLIKVSLSMGADNNSKPVRPPKVSGPDLVVSTSSFKIQESKIVVTNVLKNK